MQRHRHEDDQIRRDVVDRRLRAVGDGQRGRHRGYGESGDHRDARGGHRVSSTGIWSTDRDSLTGTTQTVDSLSCGTSYEFRVSVYVDGTAHSAAWSQVSEGPSPPRPTPVRRPVGESPSRSCMSGQRDRDRAPQRGAVTRGDELADGVGRDGHARRG